MQVKLISHSQTDGKELILSTSATELVAYCARVSNPDNQNNKETIWPGGMREALK